MGSVWTDALCGLHPGGDGVGVGFYLSALSDHLQTDLNGARERRVEVVRRRPYAAPGWCGCPGRGRDCAQYCTTGGTLQYVSNALLKEWRRTGRRMFCQKGLALQQSSGNKIGTLLGRFPPRTAEALFSRAKTGWARRRSELSTSRRHA